MTASGSAFVQGSSIGRALNEGSHEFRRQFRKIVLFCGDFKHGGFAIHSCASRFMAQWCSVAPTLWGRVNTRAVSFRRLGDKAVVLFCIAGCCMWHQSQLTIRIIRTTKVVLGRRYAAPMCSTLSVYGDRAMDAKIEKALISSGMVILPWLVIGIFIAIRLNDLYEFPHDVLSELGASGSPTEHVSPLINNHPVGLLFIAFGIGVAARMRKQYLGFVSGLLIAAHGVGSILAGVFSCDLGCPIFSYSTEQLLHTISGVSMFGSLIFANILWFRIGKSNLNERSFGVFSIACAILSVIFLFLSLIGHLMQAYASLFEALSYGILCLWCGALSYRLCKHR